MFADDLFGGDTAWGLADHQGSIRDLVSNASTSLGHVVFNSFGQKVGADTRAVDFLFGYTGREFDAETGLQYNRGRYYDPVIGRWLSEDPSRFTAGDANLYRYVGNNPLSNTDPSGLRQYNSQKPSSATSLQDLISSGAKHAQGATSLQSLLTGGSEYYDPYATGGPLEWTSQTPRMNVNLTQPSSGSVIAPEQTSLQYWYEAAQQKVGLLPGQRSAPRDAIQLNERITGAYAEMYLNDPDTYKWAGMAAYASEVVGDAMKMSQWFAEQTTGTFAQDLLNFVGIPTGQQLAGALAAGNRLVYDDIYWQHMAHREGGSELISRIVANDSLSEHIDAAWRQIETGRRSGDSDMVWKGNEQLLLREQSETLQQGVYDKLPGLWGTASFFSSSPIPGDWKDFYEVSGRWSQLDNFDQRWNWISTSMLPAYRQLDTDNREVILNDMRDYRIVGQQD